MRTKIASMKYLLYFIAAVMMFGSSGIVASTLPLSAFEVCLMRLIIGALFMGLIFVVTRQQLPRHIGRRQYLFVALSGACLGLAMMTIFAAYRLLGVGLGAVLAATAPVIRAKDEQVAQAISVIFLFNVVAALIFPTLGGMLGMSNEGFGLFAGTAVNDTSSVTAAAAAWDGMHPGANALDQAAIVKLTRTLAIIPITLVLGIWVARRESRDPIALEAQGHSVVKPAGKLGGFSLRRALPVFILLFLAASVITTIAVSAGIDAAVFEPLKTLSKFFIVMAMAAIGLNTDIVHLVKSGGKPILMGLCCWVAIAAVSLGMQHVLGLW